MGQEMGVPSSAEERIGVVLLEKWRLDAVLGAGGTGVVYAATHRTGKRVAIKLLHAGLQHDQQAQQLFLRQAYVANLIDHPNVVSVLDDDHTEDGQPFLVMELLEGETCLERMHRQGRPMHGAETLRIADELLDALSAAHAKGVFHRDIKPENVFLCRDGSVKVLDFGMAGARETFGPSRPLPPGHVVGTPAFMSPEQARGEQSLIDARSDIWSVGATLFTLLTGRWVHEGATPHEIVDAASTRPPPPISTVLPSVNDQVATVVDRALSFDRDRRWPSARAMQTAVRRARQTLYDRARRRTPRARPATVKRDPSSAPAPSTPHGAAPRPRWPHASAAALLLGAATAGLVVIGRNLSSSDASAQPAAHGSSLVVPDASSSVLLRISASPSAASLSLDGAPLTSNPHESRVARGRDRHRLLVEAQGYVPVEKSFTLEQDTRIEIELVQSTVKR